MPMKTSTFATTRPYRLIWTLLLVLTVSACQWLESMEDHGSRTGANQATVTAPTPVGARPTRPEPVARVSNASGEVGATNVARRPQPEIFYGNGRFVKPTVSSRTVEITADGDVAVNFVDANVREVLRAVLGEILGYNYIVDPSVQGTITLQATRPLPRDSLLDALELALDVNGAALVKSDGIYQVVPAATAPSSVHPIRIYSGEEPPGQGYGVSIVPLEYVGAEDMQKLLKPMAGSDTVLYADKARNFLIVGAPHGRAKSLIDTASMFDVDWLAGMSFGYFPVQYTDAEVLSDELEAVLAGEGGSPIGDMIRIVPIKRLNMILVISPQPRYVEHAHDWIRRLDQAGDDGTQRLFVYYVENGRATEIADVLNQIAGGPAAAGQSTSGTLAPSLEQVRLTGATLSQPVQPPDDATAPESNTVEQPRANVVTGAVEGPSVGADLASVRVIADEANNALVILATKSQFQIVREALERLDLVPLQVLIEATIAEVTLTDELKYGIEWFVQNGDFSASFSRLMSGAVTSSFPGFSFLFTGSDATAVLNALASLTDVRVISSPHLLVLDNRSAELQVGDQVPVATQSAVSVTDPAAPIVNTIQFFDTGVILRVTPRVNPGGLITLEIEQEVSKAVKTTTSDINSPTIQQRRITSNVAVESGETIALGGLIRDDETHGNSGIPYLKDLPVVGHLFGVTDNNKTRTELIVLLTPRAVRDESEARTVTEEFQRRMQSVIPLESKIR